MYDPTTLNSSGLCSAQCCVDESNVFQPKDNPKIKSLKTSGPGRRQETTNCRGTVSFHGLVCV